VTVVACIRKSSVAAIGRVVELGPNFSSNAGSFLVSAPLTVATDRISSSSRGSGAVVSVTASGLAAPITLVATAILDISDPRNDLYINGDLAAQASTDQGAGNFGNYALNLGSRNTTTQFFNGRIYRLLVIGRALTTTERNLAERWAAQPTGIILP